VALATSTALIAGSPVENDPARALQLYLEGAAPGQSVLGQGPVEVEIDASLPRLKKSGRMHALRDMSGPGKLTYQVLSYVGDNMIKKEVIARSLSAERKALELGSQQSLEVNQENYEFIYTRSHGSGDWTLHLFELRPRKRRLGLFHGWLWIEAQTGLPVRESGRFVKSPSIWVKQIEFLRDYELQDGVSVPILIQSSVSTRIVGTALLSLRFGESTHEPSEGQLASREVSTDPSPPPGTQSGRQLVRSATGTAGS